MPAQPAAKIHLMQEFHAVLRPQVQLVLAISTLSSVAMFCVFTYIAPILERVTHVTPHTVTWVLVIFGVGITLGNLVGGKLADWRQMSVILCGFILLIGIFLVMPFAEPYFLPSVAVLFLWGVIHFAAASPLQARIVEMAVGAPNLASTLNQGAFNLGNALGAALGGLVLTAGYGYRNLSFASAVVVCAALGAALVARWLGRRQGRRPEISGPVFGSLPNQQPR